jgi:hypothetical protein
MHDTAHIKCAYQRALSVKILHGKSDIHIFSNAGDCPLSKAKSHNVSEADFTAFFR